MSSFGQDLWSSIFTPGPTPTLLVATNITFAALQILLFVLLIATFSVHFLVLSILSSGLWWSINWFAREVQAAQSSRNEKEKQPRAGKKPKSEGAMRPPGTIDTSESETETETAERVKQTRTGPVTASIGQTTVAASPSLHAPPENEHLRKRPSISGDSSEHGSTDSEWEKVDANNHA